MPFSLRNKNTHIIEILTKKMARKGLPFKGSGDLIAKSPVLCTRARFTNNNCYPWAQQRLFSLNLGLFQVIKYKNPLKRSTFSSY